ncbi:hypothetical protein HUJ04_004971 [Dendroctonus ponderosae]|nr:hypothetical protein HUJ04_004971 [Dendroctonus ponderosae]
MPYDVHNVKRSDSSPQVEFLSGLGSAFVTITTTYPITKLIYRQILINENVATSLRIMRNEGPRLLYRGALPPMLQRCVALSSMFGIYRAASIPLETLHMNEYMEKVSACVLSGTFEAFFMPLERIQLLLVSSQFNNRFKNMLHVVKVIVNDYNWREFYRGYNIILFRNITSNTFFFLTKDELSKRIEVSDVGFKRNIENFLFGSIVGSFMTLLFHPLKVIKANIHKQLGGKFKTTKEVVQEIYGSSGGGIANFYRGALMSFARALLSWGITNASYEYIKKQIS